MSHIKVFGRTNTGPNIDIISDGKGCEEGRRKKGGQEERVGTRKEVEEAQIILMHLW